MPLKVSVIEAAIGGFEEHVDAFVAVLVTAARCHDESVVGKVGTRQGVCHLQYLGTGFATTLCEGCSHGHKVCFEAVGQYSVGAFVKQFGTLISCHVAHGCEAIDVVRRLTFYAMLCLHVQLAGHLRTVVCPKVLVEGLSIACYAAADACGMGGEDGGYLWHMLPYVECAEAGHPFVSLIDDFGWRALLLLAELVAIEALYHESCRIAEHAGFVVVAIGVEAVHLEILPCLAVEFVLPLEVRLEVHQHDTRLARDVPTSHPDAEAVFRCLLHPRTPHLGVLREERILLALPHIGAYEHELVGKLLLQCLGTGGQHSIDATHLIADLPTAFKNKVWN